MENNMFKKIEQSTTTTHSINGKTFSSTISTIHTEMPASLFTLFGVKEEHSPHLKPLSDYVQQKQKQENLSSKIKKFLEDEFLSLQGISIPEDELYLVYLGQLGRSGFNDADELFFMKQMISRREEKQASLNSNSSTYTK